MRPSHLGLLLLSVFALFLIPVSVILAQDLPESTVSARIPNHAPFFPQSDSTMPHRPSSPSHKGDSFIPHPPQVPFDVAGYPVAPQNLQLEQVHVYVRHGTYQISHYRLRQSVIFVENRRTHPGWCPTCRPSSKHSRTLDDV